MGSSAHRPMCRLVLVLPVVLACLGAELRAGDDDPPAFTQEQLDQMLAPLALYPDDLLTQILMACTYPLEIVQADRWVQANKALQGDAASKALEQEDWDPSVKSLVAVPDVLAMLSEKLDWTQQVGDAFIAQQKQVLDTVQALRAKAKENGQLESNENQTVTAEGSPQVIVIQSASPEVIYVPVYDTTVVYGYWPYPAYPPYPYYPPHYAVGVGIAVGLAWGYAWGHCDWHGGDVDVDIDQNVDINHNIDRDKYRQDGAGRDRGKGTWKHDPAHRGQVPYRDKATADRLGGVSTRQATQARDAYRGRADTGRESLARDSGTRLGAADNRAGGAAGSARTPSTSTRNTGTRSGALDGVDRSSNTVRSQSARGQSSRSSATRGSSGGGGRRGGGRGGR